jgi:hypothetical protein
VFVATSNSGAVAEYGCGVSMGMLTNENAVIACGLLSSFHIVSVG